MRRRYRTIPSRRPLKGTFIDDETDYVSVPDLIVYDPEPQTVRTGILDARGEEIVYDINMMEPIGFIHFPDTDEEDDEDRA